MQNIITGEVRSGTPTQSQGDQGWAPVSSSPSGQRSDAWSAGSGSVVQQAQLRPQMSLADAQRRAAQAFSGMQSPMSLDLIRQREQEAQDLARQTAGTIYKPQIKRSEQLGRGEVSTVGGVIGQSAGFNVSTAESAYLNNVQREVQARTQDIVNTKAQFIADGDFRAAERADQQIAQLQEYENQLVMAKANYALQIMQGDRDAARLALEGQRFELEKHTAEFQQEMAEKNYGLQLAGLTGEMPDGTPTFQALQASIQNSFAKAGITGYYQDAPTMDRMYKEAQLDFQQQGMDLNRAQFELAVRAQEFSESMARARANAASTQGLWTKDQNMRLLAAGIGDADPNIQLQFLYGNLEGQMDDAKIQDIVNNSQYSMSDDELWTNLKKTFSLTDGEATRYVNNRVLNNVSNDVLKSIATTNINMVDDKVRDDKGNRIFEDYSDILSGGHIFDPVRNDWVRLDDSGQRVINSIISLRESTKKKDFERRMEQMLQ